MISIISANWHIFFLVIFLFISALSSASETAFFSLSQTKISAFSSSSDLRKQQIAKLLKQPRELIVTILMINVFVNLMVQNISSAYFGDYSSWALSVGVPLGLTLFFGDLLPKIFGIAHNEKMSRFAAPIFTVLKKILNPVQTGLTWTAAHLARIIFFFLKKEPEVSLEELSLALDEIRTSGTVSEEEADLLSGYLRLQETLVQDLMRSRDEIFFYDLSEDLSKLIYLMKDQKLSRIPICDGGLDKIVGIMTVRLFLKHYQELTNKQKLQQVMDPPYFVPESTPARVLLYQLKKHHEFFAVVIDEYGSVTGIITLEDLTEEIIGDITHPRLEKNSYTRSAKDELICSGKMELAAIEDVTGVRFKTDHRSVTIAGYLIEKLDMIPTTGMTYEDEQNSYQILSADPHRIRRVKIIKKEGDSKL